MTQHSGPQQRPSPLFSDCVPNAWSRYMAAISISVAPYACPFMGTATFRLIGDGVNGMLELSLEWKKMREK